MIIQIFYDFNTKINICGAYHTHIRAYTLYFNSYAYTNNIFKKHF